MWPLAVLDLVDAEWVFEYAMILNENVHMYNGNEWMIIHQSVC